MVHRLAILCSALFLLLAGGAAADDPAIRIDAGRKASYRVPRTIYGTFLEPIGNSLYGGLWAQLLANPSFEDNLWSVSALERMVKQKPALREASNFGVPLPWEPLYSKQGIRYEPRWLDAANSFRSLLLMALPGKVETGIRQEIYLPVHRTSTVEGKLYCKHVAGVGKATVSLRRRDHPEEVLASQTLTLAGGGWKEYRYTLAVAPGKVKRLEPVDFVIAATDETRMLVDQALVFPSDHLEGLDPDMVALSRALRTPIVRYGGNFTSTYHWRDGVGPMDKRVTMANLSWGGPEYNHFGTGEFLNFCKRIGAEPQICVNLGSGTAEEAADWVRFVNRRWNGGRGGLWWELGNELYGTWQDGYPTLERIAALTRRFAEAVRKADPKARLIATGQDPDHFEPWNAQVLSNAPGLFELLSTHFVVGGARVRKPAPDDDFVALSAFAMPVGLERRLRQMKEQIEATPHRGKVGLAFTEWLFHGPNKRVSTFHNMGGAICAAGMLSTFIRTANFMPINDMTGLIEFGGIWKRREQVYGVPAYYAFRMYSTADATVPVAVDNQTDMYDITDGNTRVPDIPRVPYLDVVAALNDSGDRLTLFAINRDPRRDRTASIELSGFRAEPGARVQTLTAAGISAESTEEQPEAVKPVEARVTLGASYTFPKLSVTVIELRRKP
ncbi:MAG: hypothetical protein NTY38_32115 [Acidobacteria bacterium]|nr:hypothetical protein [Acidobacteriota bacterium]